MDYKILCFPFLCYGGLLMVGLKGGRVKETRSSEGEDRWKERTDFPNGQIGKIKTKRKTKGKKNFNRRPRV